MQKIEFASAQTEEMKAMRRNGKTWDEIGIAFKVSSWTARQHVVGRYAKRNRNQPRGLRMVDLGIPIPQKTWVPDQVLADRDRRADLPPRDLTASVFGDPLPGYSALDRR